MRLYGGPTTTYGGFEPETAPYPPLRLGVSSWEDEEIAEAKASLAEAEEWECMRRFLTPLELDTIERVQRALRELSR